MITIITGNSGTGKTLAALNFAQGADTLFFIGDENEATLRRKAADLGLDLSKTVFESDSALGNLSSISSCIKQHLSTRSVTRVVIEDVQAILDLGFGQSQQLRDLADKYNLHVLLTNLTRRASWKIEAVMQRVDGPPTSLRDITDNHIHLDTPFDTRPTGVLVKSLPLLPHPVPEELFGIKLRQES